MSENEEMILDTDDRAARLMTGWVSRDGRFYGDDERMARYAGCTHRACEDCGKPTPKHWLVCAECRDKRAVARYATYPRKPYGRDCGDERVMPSSSMNTRILNLTDGHRRLHLQHSEDEPAFLYVLLFVEDRVLVCARVDLKQCQFSMSSAGPLFWVGAGTNFFITEQERREIERFLRTPREPKDSAR